MGGGKLCFVPAAGLLIADPALIAPIVTRQQYAVGYFQRTAASC